MVKQLLNAQQNFEVVGEATDGAHAVTRVESLKPDVAVLNVVMPHISGLRAARRIPEAMPDVAVVILSTDTDEQFLRQVKHRRAKGSVGKIAK
jgi:two-component system response regulator DegU